MIDFHAHLGKVKYGHPPLTVERLIRFMDAHGIKRAVILPLVNPEEEDYYYTTEQALEDCAQCPERLIPFANIDPRRGSNDGAYDFYPLLKEYANMGCKGFGEILANLPTNDPRMKGIYRACEKLGFPIVLDFRLGSVGVYDPVGMPYLEECLREFPNAIFVAHGPGWWAEISADVTIADKNSYPRGAIKAPGRVDYLLSRYPNLYADLSAGSGLNALSRDLSYAREFLLKHHRKLLFGTDYFVGWEKAPIIDLIKGLGLPSSVERAIFVENAERLLGITESE